MAERDEIALRRRAAHCRRLAEGAVPFDVASALYRLAREFEAQAAAAAWGDAAPAIDSPSRGEGPGGLDAARDQGRSAA